MEDLDVARRAAEQHVNVLLKSPDEPIGSLLKAFEEYRNLCEACVFADFQNADKFMGRLWLAHSEGKRYFQRALNKMRQQGHERTVETRQLTKLYLLWIKASTAFYRGYIARLNDEFGGISELEAVAHHVRSEDPGRSRPDAAIDRNLREKVLSSCHQTLIYLGDLSRYRASDQLDKTPNFGPAIGYYSLACKLRPSSGMGQHQQAVVALEQRHHLRAIYHLYRAMVVADPHPSAEDNLRLEFNKINAAWDRGDLIQKRAPNDPEAPKHALIGWFIRLHSMCSKGQVFRGHDELERELLSQLSVVVKLPTIDGSLMRMVLVNLAAQFEAVRKFTNEPSSMDRQRALFNYLRINLRTFATLLRAFSDDLRTLDGQDMDEDDLALKLTPVARRLLPCLRVYSAWLLPQIHIIQGLAQDDFLKGAVDELWSAYAVAVDMVAEIFPIWDLEDLPELGYMLEEDVDTYGFLPLEDDKAMRNWIFKPTGAVKPRFSDRDVARLSADEESLARVRDFLTDGLHLANDNDQAPLKLQGTRIYYGAIPQATNLPETTLRQEKQHAERAAKAAEARKPLSYAAAAANPQRKAAVSSRNGETAATGSHAQQARLTRMVDELVEDDDGDNPITPPQQYAAEPAVVTNGEASYAPGSYNVADSAKIASYQAKAPPARTSAFPRSQNMTPPPTRTAHNAMRGAGIGSNAWAGSPASSFTSPAFPPGLPMGTMSSPDRQAQGAHSRVNSSGSIRSRGSQNVGDSWSSLESAPRDNVGAGRGYSRFSASNMASPLLFGAGGSPWSAVPSDGYRNTPPPNGQGG